MQSKENKILLTVVGVLVLAAIIFFFAASEGGGGGGGGAPSVSVPSGGNEPSSGVANQDSGSVPQEPLGGTQLPKPKNSSEITMGVAFDAATSPEVPTVAAVRSDMTYRGLENSSLKVDFDINGKYSDSRSIEQDSNEKYPSYIIEYLSKDNNPWLVFINNGNYIAYPLFGPNTGTGKQIVILETDYITGYDGIDNTFINTIPAADDVILKQVSVIDKATLDSFTVEELEKL